MSIIPQSKIKSQRVNRDTNFGNKIKHDVPFATSVNKATRHINSAINRKATKEFRNH